MNRRNFLFWVGLGLFTLGDRLKSGKLEAAAAICNYNLFDRKDRVEDFNTAMHEHLPSGEVRRREGRPPSKWLRNLNANEIRIWLKTIKVPPSGIEGMTYTYHLVNHHLFYPKNIWGLTQRELLKLHSAAHYGY